MELEKREAAIEAILFTMGDAVEAEKIAAAIELDTPSTEKLLHEMMERYRKEDRGIQMIELDHSYQLCTKKEYCQTAPEDCADGCADGNALHHCLQAAGHQDRD